MGRGKGDERQSRGIALTVGMFVGILVFWIVLLVSNDRPAGARFLDALIFGCVGFLLPYGLYLRFNGGGGGYSGGGCGSSCGSGCGGGCGGGD